MRLTKKWLDKNFDKKYDDCWVIADANDITAYYDWDNKNLTVNQDKYRITNQFHITTIKELTDFIDYYKLELKDDPKVGSNFELFM